MKNIQWSKQCNAGVLRFYVKPVNDARGKAADMDEVLTLLRTGKISAGHAKAVLALPDDKRKIEAAATIAEQNLSVRQAEKLCAKQPKQEKIALPQSKSTVAQEVEISLKQALGVEVSVNYTDGRGKLSVSFYSKEQLLEFANKLAAK